MGDGDNAFGYARIEGDLLVTYTDDPRNPTIHQFESTEIINAVKLAKKCEAYFKRESVENFMTPYHFELLKEHLDDDYLP